MRCAAMQCWMLLFNHVVQLNFCSSQIYLHARVVVLLNRLQLKLVGNFMTFGSMRSESALCDFVFREECKECFFACVSVCPNKAEECVFCMLWTGVQTVQLCAVRMFGLREPQVSSPLTTDQVARIWLPFPVSCCPAVLNFNFHYRALVGVFLSCRLI